MIGRTELPRASASCRRLELSHDRLTLFRNSLFDTALYSAALVLIEFSSFLGAPFPRRFPRACSPLVLVPHLFQQLHLSAEKNSLSRQGLLLDRRRVFRSRGTAGAGCHPSFVRYEVRVRPQRQAESYRLRKQLRLEAATLREQSQRHFSSSRLRSGCDCSCSPHDRRLSGG